MNKKEENKRVFNYNYDLLPNKYIAELEKKTTNIETAKKYTGLSLGYPSWNLLYYLCYCSLPIEGRITIVETGTNNGYSTIILAQVLKDSGKKGKVYSVDLDPKMTRLAKENIDKAGLSEYVELSTEDSIEFLSRFIKKDINRGINFILIDDKHENHHVRREFELIYDSVVKVNGLVFLDNTIIGEVSNALKWIKEKYKGNMIEFQNCGWNPPGVTIWKPNPNLMEKIVRDIFSNKYLREIKRNFTRVNRHINKKVSKD